MYVCVCVCVCVGGGGGGGGLLYFLEIYCFMDHNKILLRPRTVNTLRPRDKSRNFADDIFKRIFFNENVWISIKISLKFVLKGPINMIPAMFQIMAWRHPGLNELTKLDLKH